LQLIAIFWQSSDVFPPLQVHFPPTSQLKFSAACAAIAADKPHITAAMRNILIWSSLCSLPAGQCTPLSGIVTLSEILAQSDDQPTGQVFEIPCVNIGGCRQIPLSLT
jgi:hypothetical protein